LGSSSKETKGICLPSTVLTKILVAKAPRFSTLMYYVFCSPKITSPKSTVVYSTDKSAFLHVQIKGISIRPVSASIGKTLSMSWLS
jgi:hypothetical protein